MGVDAKQGPHHRQPRLCLCDLCEEWVKSDRCPGGRSPGGGELLGAQTFCFQGKQGCGFRPGLNVFVVDRGELRTLILFFSLF